MYAYLASIVLYRGQFAEAKRLIAQARPVVERLASPEPSAFLQFVHGWLAYERGDYVTAESLLAEAMATFRDIGPSTLVWYFGLFGLVEIALGKEREALACVAELEEMISNLTQGSMITSEALTYLGAMAVMLSDRDRARRYYSQLMAFQ